MIRQAKSFDTEAIHGSGMKDAYGALITPIYNSSTFIFDSTAQGAARFALSRWFVTTPFAPLICKSRWSLVRTS